MKLLTYKGIDFRIDGLEVQSVLKAGLDMKFQYDYLKKGKYLEIY